MNDRWFNIRPSNTEPVLRLNVEAPSKTEVAALVEMVGNVVEEVSRAGAA
jgi:phosphomannomutase